MIETKYAIGDKVFYAGLRTAKRRRECPDCKGERTWKAVSPAGQEYSFSCPRCSTSYAGHHELSLDYSVFEPSVQALTIGSIRVDTADEKAPVSYMCCETGVGSGHVYDEARLLPTEDIALQVATLLAQEQTSQTEWMAKQYNRAVEVCDYQLDSAMIREAKSQKISMRVKVGGLFDDLRECATISEVHERLERGFDEEDSNG